MCFVIIVVFSSSSYSCCYCCYSYDIELIMFLLVCILLLILMMFAWLFLLLLLLLLFVSLFFFCFFSPGLLRERKYPVTQQSMVRLSTPVGEPSTTTESPEIIFIPVRPLLTLHTHLWHVLIGGIKGEGLWERCVYFGSLGKFNCIWGSLRLLIPCVRNVLSYDTLRTNSNPHVGSLGFAGIVSYAGLKM